MTTLTEPRALAAAKVFTAAKHLVDYGEGLTGALLDLAEVTAEQDTDTAAKRIARLLYGFGVDEAYRRGAQITHVATSCWGIFPEIGARRENALATLRDLCHATAVAHRDALHVAAVQCLGDGLRARLDAAEPDMPGGIQL